MACPDFVPLAKVAEFLELAPDTLRQYLAQSKYGLIGVKGLSNPNGGPARWLAVRWDTVIGFKAERSRALSARSQKAGRRSRGTISWNGKNHCPVCQCVSPGDAVCDLCLELEDKPYYHRRVSSGIQPARNGRIVGLP